MVVVGIIAVKQAIIFFLKLELKLRFAKRVWEAKEKLALSTIGCLLV